MKNILLVSHYSGTPGGPVDKLYNYLVSKKHRISTIKHPLYPGRKDLKSEITNFRWKIYFKIPSFLQYYTESLYILFYRMNSLKNQFSNFDLAICFDSLSFIHTYFIKDFIRIKEIIFYKTDFSENRFLNRLYNFIYHQVDCFAYKNCDYCFSLFSTFIDSVDPLHQNSNKTFIVKSTIDLKRINKKTKKYKNSMVYAGSIEYGSNDFVPLLNALQRLKNAGYKFRFDIYGPIRPNSLLKSTVVKLRLDQLISFRGIIDNKTLIERILPRYQIGLAPYITKPKEETPDHTFLGTDLTAKIVDYIAAGLPVITTKINSGFKSITKNNFGFLVSNSDEWYSTIKTLLSNKRIYKSMRSNAIKYSKLYDIEEIITPIFKKIS